ncbi:MAG: hypothetical protein ABLT11_05410 [Candidatus Acidiferrum sp.]
MKIITSRNFRLSIAAAVALLSAAVASHAQDKVPPQFQGDWVPATAACDSAVRFRVTESRMTLINGADKADYGDLGTTATYFGNDYQGISVVFLPELNGNNPPFTVFFNADEKKGVTKVDIYTEMPGPLNAPGKVMQAAAKKLATRFPINRVPLKKCPRH